MVQILIAYYRSSDQNRPVRHNGPDIDEGIDNKTHSIQDGGQKEDICFRETSSVVPLRHLRERKRKEGSLKKERERKREIVHYRERKISLFSFK